MSTLTPDETRQRLETILTAVQAQDIVRAQWLAREALDLGVQHALPLNLRAWWHESEGRYREALADLQRAENLAPDDVPVLNALGLAYARQGRMADAVACFDRILALEPNFPAAHFNKGWTSEDLGELDIARACYSRAAELTPQAADPPARLAALAARQGQWGEARAQAEHALTLQPNQPLAVIALAEADIAARDYMTAEQHLSALLALPELSPPDRARADGALADLLDAQGRTVDAFAAYERRNANLLHQQRARFTGPGVETMPQYLRWLSGAFERLPPMLRGATAPSPANAHVFILGFARSGTTLLEEALARDPSVVTTQERDAMTDSVREFIVSPEGLRRLPTAGDAVLADWRAAYWRRITEMGLDPHGKTVIDKQPFNTYRLPLIARLFPDAKIVFSIRDPRDVVLSCFRREFRMNPSTFEFLTLEGTARLYDATMRIADLFRERLPLDLHQYRHEDLVADFDTRMRAICNFIGLPISEAMRNFANASGRRAVATPSSAQLRRGLTDAGIGQWRAYRCQLTPVLPLLEPWVARFGYPAE